MKIGPKVEIISPIRAERMSINRNTVLLFGIPGAGKTRTLGELLLRDEHMVLCHCGLGEPGSVAIRNYLTVKLKSEKKAEDLIEKAYREITIKSIETFAEITKNGWSWFEAIFADEPEFLKNLSAICVEEFNSGQSRYERSIVPMVSGMPRQTLTRKADDNTGSDGSYGHYANIKMATEYIVDKIFDITSPYRKLRHVWTTHEKGDVKGVSPGGEIGPALQTTAVVGVVGAFDFVIRCKIKRGSLGRSDEYKFGFRESAFTKVRGEGWPSEIEADPHTLWDMIDGKVDPSTIKQK